MYREQCRQDRTCCPIVQRPQPLVFTMTIFRSRQHYSLTTAVPYARASCSAFWGHAQPHSDVPPTIGKSGAGSRYQARRKNELREHIGRIHATRCKPATTAFCQ